MSYWDELWPYRWPVSVINVPGTGTIDINITFPAHWDLFWDNVLSTGYDIRITESDGRTPITLAQGNCLGWDITGFSKTNRTGTLRLNDWNAAPAVANTACKLFVYWGNDAATSAWDGVATTASPQSGIIETRSAANFPFQITTASPVVGSLTPSDHIQKGTKDIVEVAIDFSNEIAIAATKSEGSFLFEEMKNVDTDAGQRATSVLSVIDRTKTRFLTADSHVVVVHLRAGTNGQTYWIETVLTTSLGLKYTRRFLMTVQDHLEA